MTNQSLSLYQITNEMRNLLSQLYDKETGEVNIEIQEKIDELEPNINKKCISLVNYIKSMESNKRELDYLKQEIIKRENAYSKEITRLKNYLINNMDQSKITEIKCPYFTIKISKNPFHTDIIDENLIPEKFMKTKEIIKTEIKPDKNLIKEEYLKTGLQIPGTNVNQSLKLEIIIDKI